jgi:hypothetical protein
VLHPFAVLSAPDNTLANFDIVLTNRAQTGIQNANI